MAEISSLLGLITDDNTRQALIAQMENMFDNAPDEERLIQEIGNPTKVAVALIRYADSGKITPAAAPVVAPEQVQPKRAPQPRPRAEQYRPIAPQPAPQPAYADQAAEDAYDEQPAAPVLDGQFSFDEQPEEGYYDEQPADDGYYDEQPADDGYYDEQPEEGYYDEQPADDGYYDEQPADDGYYDEQPADDGYYDEQPEGGYDPNYATDGEEGYYDEAYYEDKPAYKTNVFLAILYTLGAIVVGVPVLAVLLVLDLAVLAVGAACGAGGVGLIATAFIGLPMVADMLILLGGGAAVIAIALVVIWLAIWLFIRMVIGWVRLLVRTGKRWCRKEIAA